MTETFEFMVRDPEKRGGGALGGYWVYHIHATTTLPRYKQSKMETVKRYNQFLWLREQLVLANPGCIVPPIPEKENFRGAIEKVSGGSEPSTLVAYRTRALRKFLVRLGAHPKLQNSGLLEDFLQLSDDEFKKRMKDAKPAVTQEIVTIPTTLWVTSALSAGPTSEEEKKWEATLDYCERFEAQLSEVRDRLDKMMRSFSDLAKSSTESGLAYKTVLDIEKSQGNGGTLPDSMEAFAKKVEGVGPSHENHAGQVCIHVAESVSYYQGLCGAVLCAIRRMLRLKHTRDLLEEEVKRLKGQQSNPQTAKKLQGLEDKLAEASDRYQEIAAELEEEMRRFHREKAWDFKGILTTYVSLTQEYAKRQQGPWNAFLSANKLS